jgi:hypothetical protein
MEGWQIGILVLVAMLVGSILPVLFQLRSTLRAVENVIKHTLPQVEHTLDDVSEVADQGAQMVEGITSTTRLVSALGAAIGPAIVAGVSSYRSAREAAEQEKENDHVQPRQRLQRHA